MLNSFSLTRREEIIIDQEIEWPAVHKVPLTYAFPTSSVLASAAVATSISK